jgi:hypothetical protein
VAETTSSLESKREKAAQEWASSSAPFSKGNVDESSGDQQEYVYVYVDENGEYYEANGEQEDEEEEVG